MGPKLLQLLLALVIIGSATAGDGIYEELTKNCIKEVTTCIGFPTGTCSTVVDGFGKKGVCKAFISGFKVKGKTDEYRITLAAKVGDAGEITIHAPNPKPTGNEAKDYANATCFTKDSSPKSSFYHTEPLKIEKDTANAPQLNGDWLICTFIVKIGGETNQKILNADVEVFLKDGSDEKTYPHQNVQSLLAEMDKKEIEPPKYSDSNVIRGPFFLVVTGAALVLHQVLQLEA